MKKLTMLKLFEIDNTDNKLLNELIRFNPAVDMLERKLIDDYMAVIKRRFKFPTKHLILSDYSNDRVVLIFNPNRLLLPIYIPAYLFNTKLLPPNSSRYIRPKEKAIALVNLSRYGRLIESKGQKEFVININTLYALMQAGTILIGCYNNFNRIKSHTELCRLGSLMYSRMLAKVLDKMFVIGLDPERMDNVRFLSAKFFLINLIGKKDSDIVNNIAYVSCEQSTPYNAILNFNERIPDTAYGDIFELLHCMRTNILGMQTLSIRSFLNAWMMQYDQSTLFALEYFPYFCHVILSVIVNAHLCREYLIENLIQKEADKFMNLLTTIIK